MPKKTKEIEKEESLPSKKSSTSTTKKEVSTKKTLTATSASISKKNITTKKTVPEKKVTTQQKSETSIMEYYDLPSQYPQTVVKILAQTPKSLFVYWDISEEDKTNLETTYGTDFFKTTKPVLLVHNETLHYDFEVEISDFSNSWYLPIQDSDCNYRIELVRKVISSNPISTNYISISSSNRMETPNDHILLENFTPNISYRNIQTHRNTKKNFSHIVNLKNRKNINVINDLYQTFYSKNLLEEFSSNNLHNPSSSNLK